ncbi:MAG: hypothetical protein GXO62_08190 [Epsilonproteobacteria bacterium]|nr:hypothetical protein [Campylobacterota bacterium]
MRILIFLLTFLYASDTVVINQKEKENNNTIIKEELILKKWLIDKYNSIVPNILKGEPKDNFVDMQIGYDIKNKKIFSHLKVNILLPSLERKIIKESKTTLQTKSYNFKVVPFLQLYKSTPTLTIKPSFTFKNLTEYNQFTFNESLYYYTSYTEYKEVSTITLDKFANIKNLYLRAYKTYYSTDKTNLYYTFGVYYFREFYKFIRLYGFETGGERKKLPFIYYYKLFFTYRHILFDKRYLFFEFTPYLYHSKEYDFHTKVFADLSLNLKF